MNNKGSIYVMALMFMMVLCLIGAVVLEGLRQDLNMLKVRKAEMQSTFLARSAYEMAFVVAPEEIANDTACFVYEDDHVLRTNDPENWYCDTGFDDGGEYLPVWMMVIHKGEIALEEDEDSDTVTCAEDLSCEVCNEDGWCLTFPAGDDHCASCMPHIISGVICTVSDDVCQIYVPFGISKYGNITRIHGKDIDLDAMEDELREDCCI